MPSRPGKTLAFSAPAATLRTPLELAAAGLVSEKDLPRLAEVAERYAVALTPALAGLIDPENANDPIARQFIPANAELDRRAEERADPIGDFAHSPVEGLVHRYPDRVLLKLASACAVYCRFCFRREMVGPAKPMLSPEAFAAALAYIRERPQIWEVILTGGDPLVLSARRIRDVVSAVAAIVHVKVIRAHTRLPVAAPEQVTPALVNALKTEGAATYVVLHANHPRELSAAVQAACARLIDAGIPMLSQSVLLRGVNDDVETLASLMRAFVESRIKPYYLHHPDLAPGTGHFRVPISEGQSLVSALRARVSGLCQPVYVLDIPDGHGKAPVGPSYIFPGRGEDDHLVADHAGALHAYPPRTGKSP